MFKIKILKGLLKPGDIMPPESVLIKEYGISRGTVRQAMSKLIQDGLIERYPGKGSFVSYSKIEHDANRYLGLFSQEMIKLTSPVLLITRQMYSIDEEIIEYSVDIYRADKNKFVIEDTYV